MGGTMAKGLCANDEIPLLDSTEIEVDSDGITWLDERSDGSGSSQLKYKRVPIYVVILSLLSAIGGFLFGYDTGVVAGATLPITDKFHLTTFEKELFVSITVGAAAVFAIIGGVLNDRIGRKPTTLVASIVFTVGAIVLAAANNKVTLMIGRFILGIGIGFASCVVPLYISECSPAHVRGKLVTFFTASITTGQLLSSITDGLFCHQVNGWRYMLGLAAVPAIIQFFGFLFMPESPRYLVQKGKDELALSILRRLRGVVDVNEEYKAIKSACDEEIKAKQKSGDQWIITKVFTRPPVRRALIIGCALQLFQQITGINTIMYYSATIIRMSGVQDNCKAIWYASITAFFNFIFTFVGIALVERLGRRILFLGSLAGVTISLLFLGIAFQLEAGATPNINQPFSAVKDDCASQYMSCGTCVNDLACGFCFTTSDAGHYLNSTCISITEDLSASLYGACSRNSSQSISGYTLAYDYCPSPYAWMAILGMVVYLICFSPGMGPMPWTINSEIYPLWARSFCNSVTTFVNWAANLLISITFLSLSEAITRQGAFYLYASFGVVGVIFLFLVLPETRGRTLEEMETLFSGSWFVRSKSKQNVS